MKGSRLRRDEVKSELLKLVSKYISFFDIYKVSKLSAAAEWGYLRCNKP
jgi:hypothetical protein